MYICVGVFISAKTGKGIPELIEAIADTAPGRKSKHKLLIPYSDGSLLNDLHSREKVVSEEYTADGVEIEVLIDSITHAKLKKYETD